MPVNNGNFTIFIVAANALTVECLLGADYVAALSAHGVIIDCKHGCVVIKDNKRPFTLKSGVAAIPDLSVCD